MTFVPANPDFEARARESFGRQGVMGLLGARLERIEPGLVQIGLDYRPELSQQHGFFHAGVLATIADSAAGYAAFTLFPADAAVLTVEYKINLMAAADGDKLTAVGKVIRTGRTLTVCQFDVHVEKQARGTHCATGIQTLIALVGRSGVHG
jgi:uncharacterized protein (TIGR00369 family)